MTRTRRIDIGDRSVVQILDHASLRRASRDWETFTSDTPFRVPIPEESALRPVRQLPIETDPPVHGVYRRLIEHRFSRAAAEGIRPGLEQLVQTLFDTALGAGRLEVVPDLALPVVSSAIAATLGRPDDTERLRSWSLHVFLDPSTGARRRNRDLDAYLADRVDRALHDPGDDLFGDLARATVDGRPLTRDELLGYGYLVLAGGRDTVISSIAGAIWHLASNPDALALLRTVRLESAVEEYLRFLSPLPHIGRTAAVDTTIGDDTVSAHDTVSLCFAAANHDPEVFDAPDECRFDRRPNRHVAFGHGPHTCIGAPLARMELSVVLATIVSRVSTLELVSPTGWTPPAVDADLSRPSFPEELVVGVH